MTKREYIHQDVRMEYDRIFSKAWWLDRLLRTEQYYLRSFIMALRAEEYYTFESPCKLLKYFYFRKKNKLGVKLGFFIPAGCFGPDLKIAHYGSIIVNPHARIGRGCTIHGNCCIGNKGKEPFEGDSPVIGNDVNIGQGAQILGGISVADGVTIGAASVVVRSVDEPGVTVVGIPAVKLS